MKRFKKRWLIAALVLLAAVCALFFLSGSGPRYKGKRLSYWFKEYYLGLEDPRRKPGVDKSIRAIRAVGTNALPYLFEQAFNGKDDTAFRTNYYDFLKQFPASWHLPRFVSQAEIRRAATQSIHSINPPAELLLAMLKPHLQEGKGTVEFRTAIEMLCDTTNQIVSFVPYYTRAAIDLRNKESAMEALRNFGPAASSAVPDLIRWMETAPSGAAAVSCAFTLAAIGSNAAPALPLLKARFNSEPTVQFRCVYAVSLYKIDSGQTEAMDFLLGVLRTNQNPREIGYAATALGYAGPKAEVAIPDLLQVMAQSGLRVWPTCLEALQKIGAPSNQFMPLLKTKMKSPDESERFRAAMKVIEIAPGDRECHAIMTGAIESHSTNAQAAIYALAIAGTNAVDAAAVLVRDFDGTNDVCWSIIPYVLGEIKPPREIFLPQLKEKFRDLRQPLLPRRIYIASSILELDPSDSEAINCLIEFIRPGWPQRIHAIKVLSRSGPAAKAAIPALREAMRSDDDSVALTAETALRRIEGKSDD